MAVYPTNVYKKYLQNLKGNIKSVNVFHLILVGIPSSLILSVINNWGWTFLLSRQNLLSMASSVFLWLIVHFTITFSLLFQDVHPMLHGVFLFLLSLYNTIIIQLIILLSFSCFLSAP